MDEAQADNHADGDQAHAAGLMRPRGWLYRMAIVALVVLIIALAFVWFSRERIAGNLIDEALAEYGLDARYEIVSIGPSRQVIANLSIGDTQAPDFTAREVIIDLTYGLAGPVPGRIELDRPRLYAAYRDGTLSLGSLDPVIFGDSDGAEGGLPDIDMAVRDGRALVVTDFGAFGAKLEGAGGLRDGFAGKLAVYGEDISTPQCSASRLTLYGDVTSADGAPTFVGPARLRMGECAGSRVGGANIGTRLTLADSFDAIEAQFDLSSSALAYGDSRLSALGGLVDVSWRFADDTGEGEELTLSHELAGINFSGPLARAEEVELDGTIRASQGFERAEWRMSLSGSDTALDLTENAALTQVRQAGEGTLIAGLLQQVESRLTRALDGGSFAVDATLRGNGDALSLIIPQARLRSGEGETVLALSRVNWVSGDGANGSARAGQRLSGNILTGGEGLPRINGRMEQVAGSDFALRLTMADYAAGEDRLAIPRLEVRQDGAGRYGFNGMVLASGAIPDGEVSGLQLPVQGRWSNAGGLVFAERCTQITLQSLNLSQLALGPHSFEICPPEGGALVRYDDTLEIAGAVEDVAVDATLADSPMQLTLARAELLSSGEFNAEALDLVIGSDDSAIRLSAAAIDGADLAQPSGSFDGGAASLDLVPMDIDALAGRWRYSDGALMIDDAVFLLSDRVDTDGEETEPRFETLMAQGAQLSFAEGEILANAELSHPASSTMVTRIDIAHTVSSGEGEARITVPSLRFSRNFQPSDLSYLAEGVVAFADGTVTGEGQINWSGDDIESSGTFRTDDFDFAAAFGPVRAVRGEVVFTDLINLTTAPEQVLTIGAINPGIEVLAGQVVYSITNGEVIEVQDGRWPFMGGTLILRPVTINYAAAGGQDYIFEIIALDAAEFVAQMEFDNLGASGTFDGTVPIYFDEDGNGSIGAGLLISRPPGGNVSYIGELTYEDLGSMGNYAFQSLRSLDYSQMSIGLSGNLAGEIVTNFQFDGVRQGDGADRNFVTRELAKLPIRFNVNVRSETFYQLATLVRGILDPSTFANPIDQGLLRVEEGRFVPSTRAPSPQPQTGPQPGLPPGAPPRGEGEPLPETRRDDEAPVQPPESDLLP